MAAFSGVALSSHSAAPGGAPAVPGLGGGPPVLVHVPAGSPRASTECPWFARCRRAGWGDLIDRYGQPRLIAAAVTSSSCVTVLALWAVRGAGDAVLVMLAAGAGLATPPMTPAIGPALGGRGWQRCRRPLYGSRSWRGGARTWRQCCSCCGGGRRCSAGKGRIHRADPALERSGSSVSCRWTRRRSCGRRSRSPSPWCRSRRRPSRQ
jgi:hypothetical protein